MEEYRDRMNAYRAQELPIRVQKFEACATQTEEAECDASLFLRKYFLDEDGNPDQTKTPGFILLIGYSDRGMTLRGRTDRVPALHAADGGLGGASNVMVIGWDRAKVNNEAHQIDMQQSHGGGVLRSSHDWHRQMMSHRTYMEGLYDRKKNPDRKSGSAFHARDVHGRFVMECKAIQHKWPILSKDMRVRIIQSGRLAIFDLGIVFGLMVFGKTREDVMNFLQDRDWDADPDDAESTDDEIESLDLSSDEQFSDERTGRSAKRQKIRSSHPRRLHFQWRGYNTMTGAIQYDPQDRNTGFLDFANDDATSFEGNIYMDVMGGEVSFQGYKVPGLTGPLTMNWNALSHLASERAKVPKHVW